MGEEKSKLIKKVITLMMNKDKEEKPGQIVDKDTAMKKAEEMLRKKMGNEAFDALTAEEKGERIEKAAKKLMSPKGQKLIRLIKKAEQTLKEKMGEDQFNALSAEEKKKMIEKM